MNRAVFSIAFLAAMATSGVAPASCHDAACDIGRDEIGRYEASVGDDFQQSNASGRVISAGNGWQLAGKQLVRGKVITEKSEITAQGTDSSLLLDCGDEPGLLIYRCNIRPCRVRACSISGAGLTVRRIDVSSEVGSASEVSTSLLRHEPKQPSFAGVRAQGNPNDAVLLENSGKVQFGPALNRVLEGEYCLRLTSLSPDADNAPSIVMINWNRDTDPEGNTSAPGLTPGLYSLEKGVGSSGACQVEPDTVPAWVVIAPEATFTKLTAQWKTMSAQIAQLPKADVGGDVLVTLRHATLASLADSMAKR